jgi:hypothetical protein
LKTTIPHGSTSSEREISSERFSAGATVDWVAQQGIEVANPELLSQQVNELVDEFKIETGALSRGRDKLLITAIAHELGESPFGEDAAKSGRVADMIALAFGDKSRLKETVKAFEYKPGFSEERIFEAQEALTNKERSEELAFYIENDEAFVSLRERLGITANTQAPFDVRVLNIGDDRTMYGWQPEIDWENLSYDEAMAQRNAQDQQKKQMEQNQRFLSHEYGYDEDDSLPPAWIEYAEDGSKTLCVGLATAEKTLFPEAARSRGYDRDRENTSAKAFLLHEFTHTQKPILRSHTIGLGIGVEELRAEHFSGDMHGYTDIKRYYRSMQVLYDYTPKASMESGGSFDPDTFEVEMAQTMGLEGYIDAMTLIPSQYAEGSQANAFLRGLVSADGGVDGHFDTMYNRAKQIVGEDEVARRVSGFVDGVAQRYEGQDAAHEIVKSLLSYQWPEKFTEMAMRDYRARYQAEAA